MVVVVIMRMRRMVVVIMRMRKMAVVIMRMRKTMVVVIMRMRKDPSPSPSPSTSLSRDSLRLSCSFFTYLVRTMAAVVMRKMRKTVEVVIMSVGKM